MSKEVIDLGQQAIKAAKALKAKAKRLEQSKLLENQALEWLSNTTYDVKLMAIRSAIDDRSALSKVERKALVLMKDEFCTSTGVIEMLDCKLSELNRWDSGLALPHALQKKVSIHGKFTTIRYWWIPEVEAFKQNIEAQRIQDNIDKAIQRASIKLQA